MCVGLRKAAVFKPLLDLAALFGIGQGAWLFVCLYLRSVCIVLCVCARVCVCAFSWV